MEPVTAIPRNLAFHLAFICTELVTQTRLSFGPYVL